ncbi:MAG: hypothetical protein HYY85_03630 [Deltaproteobacteria bacterium]|nr:hypothetical protein [Deltaproteobacteria bacterium]
MCQEAAQEVDRLICHVLRDGQRRGQLDLEASEMAIRASMHQIGGVVLEKLLNADGGGYRGARIDCGQGHEAEFVDYRRKEVLTVLAPVQVQRAYYSCADCGGGVIPKDQELDIAGTSFSPGVRRMMGRVGAKEAFDEGRRDLHELAGVVVRTKAVERVAEALGDEVEAVAIQERHAALAGKLVSAEAVRRGLLRAEQVIVLGDGAPWIWGIADEHFPGAIQIVDLYHAREHLADLAKLVYGPASAAAKDWAAGRREELDAGEVEQVVAAMRRLRPRRTEVREAVRKAVSYFKTNAERMRYARFRSQGLFVGSGVVEAGCKTIVGLRLKQSGMRWTVRGANAILALRCAELSGRWEEFWEARSAG